MKTIKYKDIRHNVTSITKYYLHTFQLYVRTSSSQPTSRPKDVKDFTIHIHIDNNNSVCSFGFDDREEAKAALARIDNFLHHDDSSFLDLDKPAEKKIESVVCSPNPIRPISSEQSLTSC